MSIRDSTRRVHPDAYLQAIVPAVVKHHPRRCPNCGGIVPSDDPAARAASWLRYVGCVCESGGANGE